MTHICVEVEMIIFTPLDEKCKSDGVIQKELLILSMPGMAVLRDRDKSSI